MGHDLRHNPLAKKGEQLREGAKKHANKVAGKARGTAREKIDYALESINERDGWAAADMAYEGAKTTGRTAGKVGLSAGKKGVKKGAKGAKGVAIAGGMSMAAATSPAAAYAAHRGYTSQVDDGFQPSDRQGGGGIRDSGGGSSTGHGDGYRVLDSPPKSNNGITHAQTLADSAPEQIDAVNHGLEEHEGYSRRVTTSGVFHSMEGSPDGATNFGVIESERGDMIPVVDFTGGPEIPDNEYISLYNAEVNPYPSDINTAHPEYVQQGSESGNSDEYLQLKMTPDSAYGVGAGSDGGETILDTGMDRSDEVSTHRVSENEFNAWGQTQSWDDVRGEDMSLSEGDSVGMSEFGNSTADEGGGDIIPDCPECGGAFDGEHGLRTHYGKQHGDTSELDTQLRDQSDSTSSDDVDTVTDG
jgi:hypothetical protein